MKHAPLLILGLALLMAGCVASPPGNNVGLPAPTNGDTGGIVPPQTEGGAQTINVSLKNISFNPSTITVNAGDTIHFVNEDGFTHDLRVYNETGEPQPKTSLASGETKDVVMRTAGTYNLECERHMPGMSGTIIVK